MQLRIGWRALCFGVLRCVVPGSRRNALAAVEGYWGSGDVIAAYSVRTGFDMALRALELEPGDEILFSALNVKGMIGVARRLGLVAVPVDIDMDHAGPRLDALEKALSPRSRVLVVAHLFGARLDLGPVIEFARARGLVVIEDCAQAFDGRDFSGHAGADLALFSFGPIKVATALGGALIRVRERALRDKMLALRAEMPVQRNSAHFKRIVMFAALKLASSRPGMALIHRMMRWRGDFEEALSDKVREVAPLKGTKKLRWQPSTAMLQLMGHRISRFDQREHEGHRRKGERLAELIGDAEILPARANRIHNYWVFAIVANAPGKLINALRAAGFDGAALPRSQAVEPPGDRLGLAPLVAQRIIDSIVIVPCYPKMADSELVCQAAIIRDVADEVADPFGRTDVRANADPSP